MTLTAALRIYEHSIAQQGTPFEIRPALAVLPTARVKGPLGHRDCLLDDSGSYWRKQK